MRKVGLLTLQDYKCFVPVAYYPFLERALAPGPQFCNFSLSSLAKNVLRNVYSSVHYFRLLGIPSEEFTLDEEYSTALYREFVARIWKAYNWEQFKTCIETVELQHMARQCPSGVANKIDAIFTGLLRRGETLADCALALNDICLTQGIDATEFLKSIGVELPRRTPEEVYSAAHQNSSIIMGRAMNRANPSETLNVEIGHTPRAATDDGLRNSNSSEQSGIVRVSEFNFGHYQSEEEMRQDDVGIGRVRHYEPLPAYYGAGPAPFSLPSPLPRGRTIVFPGSERVLESNSSQLVFGVHRIVPPPLVIDKSTIKYIILDSDVADTLPVDEKAATCVICLENAPKCAAIPCGHLTCIGCAKTLYHGKEQKSVHCPCCRNLVKNILVTFGL